MRTIVFPELKTATINLPVLVKNVNFNNIKENVYNVLSILLKLIAGTLGVFINTK